MVNPRDIAGERKKKIYLYHYPNKDKKASKMFFTASNKVCLKQLNLFSMHITQHENTVCKNFSCTIFW